MTEAGDDRYEYKHGPRQPEEGIGPHAGPSRTGTGHGAIGDAPSAHAQHEDIEDTHTTVVADAPRHDHDRTLTVDSRPPAIL